MSKELNNDLEEQLKAIELEERKQALESKKTQDELARIQLSQLKSELETKQNNKKRGTEDAQKAMEDRRAIQAVCNHHVGGKGAMAINHGQGDMKRPTCVGAMQFLDGSFRVVCLRCFKEWRSNYPQGDVDKNYYPWQEGAALWQDSQNQEIMVVGGVKITRKQELTAA